MSRVLLPNGVLILKSTPLNWEVKKENSDGSGFDYYSIYVGGMAEGHLCIYTNNILSISNMAYSSDDPSLKFEVESIVEAGKIIEQFSKGMKISLDGTIYK